MANCAEFDQAVAAAVAQQTAALQEQYDQEIQILQ